METCKLEEAFQTAMEESIYFANNPEILRENISKENCEIDRSKLSAPYADPFAYRMTLYQGFIRFPDRLRNYLISSNESASSILSAHDVLLSHEKRKAYRSFMPTIMDIEPTSTCNFRCVMCQVSEWKNGNRSKNMTLESMIEFVKNNNLLTEVKLHGMGEPFIHKRYIEMVKVLVDQDIWVRTNTNGSLLLIRDNYKKIIDAGIGEIQCSFDGATKEVFEKIRKRSDYDVVVENFKKLNSFSEKQQRDFTRMWVTLQKDNRHQIMALVEMALRMKFKRLTFSLFMGDWGQPYWKERNSLIKYNETFTEEIIDALIEVSKREGVEISLWYQADKYSIETKETLCPWVFERPYISADLRVVPCTMIGNPQTVDLGDANNFSGTWNGDQYVKFRQLHLDGYIPDYCKNCYSS